MECNRDEALRSKDLAEKKLVSQDYQGALKFLQKALQLFPELENTSQISAVIEVHIAAQLKINGTEMDWYGILQVDPGAEDIVVKKQFKKFALLLHPDKNKYSGAEAAFKLIGEALQVLSDKQQRMLYDSRRKPIARVGHSTQRKKGRQTASQVHVNNPVASSHTFITVCPSCHMRYQYYRVYQNQNLLCPQCGLPFLAREYFPPASNGTYSAYSWQHFSQAQPGFNPSSFQPFAPASNFASGVSHTSDTVHSGSQKTGVHGGIPTADNANQMPTENAFMDHVAGGHKRKRKDEKDSEKEKPKAEKEQQKKAKPDHRDQDAVERKMQKRRKEADKSSPKDRKRRSKKQASESSDGDDNNDDDSDSEENLSDVEILNHAVDSESAPRRSSRPRRNVTYKFDASDDEEALPASVQTPSPKDVQKTQATNAAHMKESEDTVGNTNVTQDEDLTAQQKPTKGKTSVSPTNPKAATKAEDYAKVNNGDSGEVEQGPQIGRSEVWCENEGHVSKEKVEMEPDEQSMNAEANNKVGGQAQELSDGGTSAGVETEDEADEVEEGEKFVVPDAEFFDFDADKRNVRAGQVWACYDDMDGFPRFYLKVKEVLLLDPFKVSIKWLELQNLSADQQSLKKLGFLPTSGNSFKATDSQTLDAVDILSHILKWEKGPKGTVIIYPRKGEVWALYRNWKPGFRTKNKSLLQEYEMVEVLTDFDKQRGVSLACLEKLPVHKTLFKRSNHCLEIPVAELCRFSYQVPAHELQESEAPENAKGCWELDPASVPLDIISGSGESKS